jgi:tryptophan-rich sensory protein
MNIFRPWKLDDWAIFFICTIVFMPIGIVFYIVYKRDKANKERDIWEDRYISEDIIEEFR